MKHTVPGIVALVNPLTRSPTTGRLSFPIPLQIRNLEYAALNLGWLSLSLSLSLPGLTSHVAGLMSAHAVRSIKYTFLCTGVFKWHLNPLKLNKETKLRIHNITAKAGLKFGSEAWVLRKREEQRLEAAQMKCLRHLLGITKLDEEKNRKKNGNTEYSKGNKTIPEKVATTRTEDGHK